MRIRTSVLSALLKALPYLRAQMYFKASLTALSHAMEDLVLAGTEAPLVIASFQRERFYRQEAHRYRRIADKTSQVYVLAAPETEFKNGSEFYERIAFTGSDALAKEWHLVVLGQQYASCLICREHVSGKSKDHQDSAAMDNSRRFEGIWTFDRQVSQKSAELLLDRIQKYRCELEPKLNKARSLYLESTATAPQPTAATSESPIANPDPFVSRLVTYIQAGQYKLIKANRFLMTKEQRERLLTSITTAMRRSLDSQDILQVTVAKLGQGMDIARTIVYRCQPDDLHATIEHEYLATDTASVLGTAWPLAENPLFQKIVHQHDSLAIANTQEEPNHQTGPQLVALQTLIDRAIIVSWLLVPVLYQDRLLGMVELHHCGPDPIDWRAEDIALVEAVATQIGVALIQAEAYTNLESLNEQLAALDRTRSNLVAITGHELRTPLSTIQVCLESLASEPDMARELQNVMLKTALNDAERMRKLIQDFLTLSQLESGRIEWHPEPVSLPECIDLAISHIRARNQGQAIPPIKNLVSMELPLVLADGEWLVEVLTKLLDNACKFTPQTGQISLQVNPLDDTVLQVTVTDTGRGIEPNRLETIFDRFYQEEGALQRSTGGTGLGLAICRQIVNGWQGKIWAESSGKAQGSQFHFTVSRLESATIATTR